MRSVLSEELGVRNGLNEELGMRNEEWCLGREISSGAFVLTLRMPVGANIVRPFVHALPISEDYRFLSMFLTLRISVGEQFPLHGNAVRPCVRDNA